MVQIIDVSNWSPDPDYSNKHLELINYLASLSNNKFKNIIEELLNFNLSDFKEKFLSGIKK